MKPSFQRDSSAIYLAPLTSTLVLLALVACRSTTTTGLTTSPKATGSPGAPTVLYDGQTASTEAHGWHVTARLVNLEAGPSGLQVQVTVHGPLSVFSPQCDRPLRAWLVDRSGSTTNRSLVFPQPSDSCTQPYGQVRAGQTATYETTIQFPIRRGTYTVHGLLDIGSNTSTENLPTLTITLP